MRSLILGKGEIGKALWNILSDFYPTFITDRTEEPYENIEILHIAFSFDENFISEVRRYQELYKPKFTVVHSTTPVGTCRQLNAIHSPVIGRHPHLEESLITFTKMLGGEQASEVADYFRKAGFTIYIFDKSETTELLKILDTTFYGVCVEYTKDVKKQCDKFGVPFEAWTIYTNVYNHGYDELGYPEYTRPNLVPLMKKIGGHCVIPNTKFLETPFTKFICELND